MSLREPRRPRRLLPAVRRLVGSGVLAASLAVQMGARAETVDATSTTLLSGRQDLRDGVVHTAVPVYELVSVRASDLRVPGVEDMSIIMSGWGTAALAETPEDKRVLGDLDLAF